LKESNFSQNERRHINDNYNDNNFEIGFHRERKTIFGHFLLLVQGGVAQVDTLDGSLHALRFV
jgi:hypothetical protein